MKRPWGLSNKVCAACVFVHHTVTHQHIHTASLHQHWTLRHMSPSRHAACQVLLKSAAHCLTCNTRPEWQAAFAQTQQDCTALADPTPSLTASPLVPAEVP